MKTKVAHLLAVITVSALAADSSVGGDYTALSAGFLEPSREPPQLTWKADPTFDFICEAAEATLRRLHCPFTSTDQLTSTNFQPPSQIGQYLPHLAITIVIDWIEHKAVAGGGIDNNADLNQFWLSWKFESAAATLAQPDPTTAFPIFVEPNEIWDADPTPGQGRPVWHGQIANGCSPTTYVDLKMTSDVGRDGGDLGEVTLHDSIVGNGNYNVLYTVHAQEDDEASDFVFHGHARAYCRDYLWGQ